MPALGEYRVPRFKDVPGLDIHLLDRHDLPSAGGGETPIIAIAPAIANAVFNATCIRPVLCVSVGRRSKCKDLPNEFGAIAKGRKQ